MTHADDTPRNIDGDFAEAMRPIGGIRPVEIDPTVLTSSNADIVLPRDNAILEVKTLMSDPAAREDHDERIQAVFDKWRGQPGVPIVFGTVRIGADQLPERMAHQLLRTLEGSIRGATTSANRQIKVLKKALRMPDAHGVLVMCNAGATSLSPHFVLRALYHAIGKRHSSITSVIYMTDNQPVWLPGVPKPAEFYGTVKIEGRQTLPEDVQDRIRAAWFSYRDRTSGPLETVVLGDNVEALMQVRNVRKGRL